jgi:hydrogenase maturation factor
VAVDGGLNREHLGDLAADLAGTSLALARRFSSGATMWCVAIAWPHHANHVAVEFVHPVIMGKRALPAVAVTDPDPVPTLRALVRPGDILLAVGSSDEAALASALRRAAAWGVESVWIGAGPRPDAGAADHVLWADGPADRAAHAGGFVLLYHLLWELTHVCFEHPGLLKETPETCEGPTCITCGDEGRLAEVIVSSEAGVVAVRTPAGAEEIDITLVGPVAAGDLVLVHAGSAIAVVEPAALSGVQPLGVQPSGVQSSGARP